MVPLFCHQASKINNKAVFFLTRIASGLPCRRVSKGRLWHWLFVCHGVTWAPGFQPRACRPLSPRRFHECHQWPLKPDIALLGFHLGTLTHWLCPLGPQWPHFKDRVSWSHWSHWSFDISRGPLQTIHLYTAGAPYPEVNTTSWTVGFMVDKYVVKWVH